MERSVRVGSVCYKINYPWEGITDPLYLPLKRGGLVCPPLESPMTFNEPEENLCSSAQSVGEINNHPWEHGT